MSELRAYFEAFHGFSPTKDQDYFLYGFASFLKSDKKNCAVILNGYAGTGKTTLLAVCANYLAEKKIGNILLAPTGRAAKVLHSYSHQKAFTIHKIIYALKKSRSGGQYFALRKNTFKNTVFIVDEASMIGEEGGGLGKNSLLDDLMSYVFSGIGCRLVLVGDEAQLPPVGSDNSPALNKDLLEMDFNLTIAKISLNEVVRQSAASGILTEATMLRQEMLSPYPKLNIKLHPDVIYLSKYDFSDHYQEHLHKYGDDQVIYITRSNKQANNLNQEIRRHIYQSESILDGGDKLMVVKNNYHWVAQDPNHDFIANGDFCEVQRVRNIQEVYGENFADVTLYFSDYELEIEAKIWLDCLFTEQSAMPHARAEKIWSLVENELFEDYPDKGERNQKLKENPYVQAIQAKFGHAVTCHKAQGGQWPIVYVDVGFVPEDTLNKNFLRWLYTAFTRASEKVFLVNFPEEWMESVS